QIGAYGGIGDLLRRDSISPFLDDPREPVVVERVWVFQPTVGVQMRKRVGDWFTVFADAQYGRDVEVDGFYSADRIFANVSIAIPVRPWFTVMAPFSVLRVDGDTAEPFTRFEFGGLGTDGYAPIGMFVVHIGELFDFSLGKTWVRDTAFPGETFDVWSIMFDVRGGH
ncbi:MAG: hypothetical protein AAFQ82_25250, partial [Myxococcota bacterium]